MSDLRQGHQGLSAPIKFVEKGINGPLSELVSDNYYKISGGKHDGKLVYFTFEQRSGAGEIEQLVARTIDPKGVSYVIAQNNRPYMATEKDRGKFEYQLCKELKGSMLEAVSYEAAQAMDGVYDAAATRRLGSNKKETINLADSDKKTPISEKLVADLQSAAQGTLDCPYARDEKIGPHTPPKTAPRGPLDHAGRGSPVNPYRG